LPKAKKRELVILTGAELEKLAGAMPRPQDRLAVLMLAHCGPRADELWALQRGDYNPLRGTLTIERAFKDHQDRNAVGETKTGSKRVVGLPSAVRALLDEHMTTVAPATDAFIFTGPGGANGRPAGEGGPIRHELWRARVFNKVRDKALPRRPDLRVHDLRHCCASWLIASGADALQVKNWLGHSSIKTTYDTYGHLLPNNLDAVVSRLEEFHAADNVTALKAGER
jgi:integrase